MFDEILKQAGIDPASMNNEEIAVLQGWAEMYTSKTLSLSDVKDYLNQLIEAVERELAGVKPPENFVSLLFRKKRETHLKARLYNYILLRDFINQPDKMLASIKKSLQAKKANINKSNG